MQLSSYWALQCWRGLRLGAHRPLHVHQSRPATLIMTSARSSQRISGAALANLEWEVSTGNIKQQVRTALGVVSPGVQTLAIPSNAETLKWIPHKRSLLSEHIEHVEWQRIVQETDASLPLPRSGHVAAALPEGNPNDLIMFGGYTETPEKDRQASNDTWGFSLANRKWTQLATQGGPPRARLAGQGVVVGNLFWVIGGWDPGFKRDGGDILSDVWTLDLATLTWQQRALQGEQLQPISRFQAVVDGSHIYIHTHRCLDHILQLDVTDPDSPTLSRISLQTPQEEAPVSRGLHTVTRVGRKLYLFAGAPKSGPMLGDLWALDLNTKTWTELDPDGQVPHVRCSQAAAAFDTFIFYVGGSYYKADGSGLQPLNDLFVLNTVGETRWEYPRMPTGPSPRNAGTLTAVRGGRLVHFGGWDPFRQSYNDTYVLDVSRYPELSPSVPIVQDDEEF